VIRTHHRPVCRKRDQAARIAVQRCEPDRMTLMDEWTPERWVERLRDAARGGTPLDLAGESIDSTELLDIDDVQRWPPDRCVPAAAIRAALLLPDLSADPLGLVISGAYVTGMLDLRQVRSSVPLCVVSSRFETAPDLSSSTMADLDLSQTYVCGLNLTDAHIAGSLRLSRLISTGPVEALGLRIDGSLDLREASIGYLSQASDEPAAGIDPSPEAGSAEPAARQPGPVADFNADYDLDWAAAASAAPPALNLAYADVVGFAYLMRLQVYGTFAAPRLRIGGDLGLQDAVLSSPGGLAFLLDGAEIGSNAVMNRLNCDGEMHALGMTVTGQLSLMDAVLSGDGRPALSLDGAKLLGGAFLDRLHAYGEVRALHATIGNQFVLDDAVLAGQGRHALSLDGADIVGSASFARLRAIGQIHALGIVVRDQLDFDHASLSGEGDPALSLDGTVVKGDLLMRSMNAVGEIHALGMHIGGAFDLDRAAVDGSGGAALSLYGSQIAGDLTVLDAVIDGNFGAESIYVGGELLVLEAAISTELNLSSAKIHKLIGPSKAGALVAMGWEIDDIGGPLRDRSIAAKWLDTRGSWPKFSPQPWHALASVFDRNGEPDDARRLRWQAARLTTRNARWWSKPGRWAYQAVAGHGYYPGVAAAWLVVLIVAAGVVISTFAADFRPTDPALAATAVRSAQANVPTGGLVTGATPCDLLAPRYPCFRPWRIAVATVVPTVPIVDKGVWAPADDARQWIGWFLIIIKASGWLLTVLLLAAITGLLRKT
jgi:hypothetical protein